jgi:hypothetical protein
VSACTYLLPIRRTAFSELEASEFAKYFKQLGDLGCEVLVVDGSSSEVFAAHEKMWREVCRHEAVDSRFEFLNDKVNGVHTGVALAANEKIILADDDIRYGKIDIERVSALLDDFEVVRPQNYLRDAHWWALTESARMLINRATLRTADYPGTCGFRRQTFLNAGDYDGDVLFDNEELIRHFARRGARIAFENNIFILKRAPSFRKWLEQRPRQAYEDFGLRFKTILFASLLPMAITLALFNPKWLSIFLLSILVALIGWLRGNARKYFSMLACLAAPVWIFERTLSTYWAFYWLVAHGGYPFGERLLKKGIGRDWIEGGRIGAKMAERSDR